MSNEIITANAEAETESVESNNISASDFALRRLGQANQTEETETAVEAEPEVEEAQDQVDESETEPSEDESNTEETEEGESTDVLSKDLDDLSEEDLRELADKLNSRAVARFGELTAKRKIAEERLAALEAKINEKDNNPLSQPSKVKDNPYRDIDSIEGLQGKAQEVNEVIEWAEDILFNSDEYSADEVVTEVEGKELTKADVRNSLRNARKSRDKFLPAQLKVLQEVERGQTLKSQFEEQAKGELKWLDGEDNDTRRQYEAMIADPRIQELDKVLAPDVSAQLPYLLAHAANSIYGRKLVGNQSSSPKLSPPRSVASSAAQSEKPLAKSTKAIKDVSQRFKSSGAKNDFITLRTLQLKNR